MQPVTDDGMTPRAPSTPRRSILIAQVISLGLIWVFVLGIAAWIINLIELSIDLNDAPGATVVISLIAIPVFFTLAGILTYVFVGLRKEERRLVTEGKLE